MKVSDYKLNPRWVCWMISRGEDPANAKISTHDEPVYVVDPEDGRSYPQGLVFSFWIRARWREWAAELGYKRDPTWGREAHEVAQLAGRKPEEFDAWLRAKVGAEA